MPAAGEEVSEDMSAARGGDASGGIGLEKEGSCKGRPWGKVANKGLTEGGWTKSVLQAGYAIAQRNPGLAGGRRRRSVFVASWALADVEDAAGG